jgi:hypothetical protein
LSFSDGRYTHAPGNTTEDFAYDKCLDIRREEQNEDKAGHCYQCADHGLAITKAFTDEAVDEKTYDFTSTSPIRPVDDSQPDARIVYGHCLQSALPAGLNRPLASLFVQYTILSIEHWTSVQ